jgi:4-nitrophenyl phosphatase
MSLVAGNVEELSGIDGLVCDLDGVVYRGAEPVDGSPEAIGRLRELGVRVVFCTNNASPTIDGYLRKLRAMGVEVEPDELVTSAIVTVEVMSARGVVGKQAIVVGEDGLREALTSIGVQVNDDENSVSADFVVVGFDQSFNYAALRRASFAIQGGAQLIACNADASFPAADGLWPGAGSLVAAIETASGARAEVMGKPHKQMMRSTQRHLGNATRIAIAGDRPSTDLEGGRAMGWTTILVLSGVTSREDLQSLATQPDIVLERLADLPELLTGTNQ